MKDRKHMSHNDLVNEVTRQLSSRFHLQKASQVTTLTHIIVFLMYANRFLPIVPIS